MNVSEPRNARATRAGGRLGGGGAGLDGFEWAYEGVDPERKGESMNWSKCLSMAAALGAAVAVGAAAGETPNPAEPGKVERKGPLAGLPSAPGPHIEKIKALGDNQWLDLGSPAADPKWGKARGRTWSARMPYAPDLGGAFLAGQGVHGFVKPDGRFMDDIFFYDLYAHRWICLYPGTDTKTFVDKAKSGELKYRDDGQLVDKDGLVVPVTAIAGHSYQWHTYDTDLRKYVLGPGLPGVIGDQFYGNPALVEGCKLLAQARDGKADRVAGSPTFFNTVSGQFERYPIDRPHRGAFNLVLFYLPSKKLLWQYDSGKTLLYDGASHQGWSDAKAKGQGPNSYDCGACYDSKRDRIYMRGFVYDVKSNAWLDLSVKGNRPAADGTTEACVHYDSANDRVINFFYMNGQVGPTHKTGVFVMDPETATWGDPLPYPNNVPVMTWNGFYSPELNAHFIHIASDSADNGTVWAYRYRRAAGKK